MEFRLPRNYNSYSSRRLHHNPSPTFFKIKKLLEMELRKHGFDRYVLFTARKTDLRRALFIANYPEHYLNEYREKYHQINDPVISRGLVSVAPFSWSECKGEVKNTSSHSLMFSDQGCAAEGYGFTLHDNDGFFSLLCVHDMSKINFSRIAQRMAAVQMLLIRTHQFLMLYPKAKNFFVTDSSVKLLTYREHEILTWAANGKTYSEIALIVGISERTVKFHMSNVVIKLQVSNAKHAISKIRQEGSFLRQHRENSRNP